MYARIQDVAALIGRIAVGVVFLAHGLDKWNAGVDGTAQMFEAVGIPLPTVAAVFVIAVEVIGAIMFIVGFATPLVGIGFAVVGLGATFAVHLDAGLTGEGGYELVLVLALAGLALGFNSGRLALDHVLVGRRRSSDKAAEPVS
ncbi:MULTISPECIES: DoxX family protein [Prauserella salsuginis group]|uniref:DoxX family protein n=1 Tax=Prauserella salsuginis TaxID=387889 RepID=A0ABW6G6R6_9PSEU|nr:MULTISPECIES: DoxX family protein [Prauserella salsuginis group]MCR3722714.1 putative oxidoreductase [Prauserella flava]MCR3737231.1 putative oxidoreductase [Prauserella salsuginis]